MARTAENSAIGVDNVVIARMLNDDVSGVTYDTPIALKGAVQVTANPNSSVETDYADNGAFFVVDNRGNLEMNLEMTNVAPDVLAMMLGQKRENGITIEGSQDQAPYFALGFRVWIGGTDENGDKIYKLYWFAKGKFSVPEAGGQTKQDNIEFQHVSMVAQFVSTIYNGAFGANCRTDYDTPQNVIQNWFNAPVISVDADTSVLTFAIAQGSSKAKITITGSKGSGETPTIAESSIKLGQNLLVTLEGELVEGVVSVAGNVITFTADTAFTTSDEVVVAVTSGIKDIAGVGATPIVSTVTIA